MNHLTESIRFYLDRCGELTEVLLNGISLFFIISGVVLSVIKTINQRRHLSEIHPRHTYFRRIFGGWLMVALEFQLAADIVGTIVSPTKEHLIELGAIAVIRTFLNYFLNKELNEVSQYSNDNRDKNISYV